LAVDIESFCIRSCTNLATAIDIWLTVGQASSRRSLIKRLISGLLS